MELLRINHRKQYDAWLDIELRWMGDHGYQHVVDTVYYGYSNKKINKVHIVSHQSGDIISHEEIEDITPQTYRLIDRTFYDSYKDQIKEHKRSTVSKSYKRKKNLIRKY
jgi:hypothetical protein